MLRKSRIFLKRVVQNSNSQNYVSEQPYKGAIAVILGYNRRCLGPSGNPDGKLSGNDPFRGSWHGTSTSAAAAAMLMNVASSHGQSSNLASHHSTTATPGVENKKYTFSGDVVRPTEILSENPGGSIFGTRKRRDRTVNNPAMSTGSSVMNEGSRQYGYRPRAPTPPVESTPSETKV